MGDLILYQNLILKWLLIRNVETLFSVCLKIDAISWSWSFKILVLTVVSMMICNFLQRDVVHLTGLHCIVTDDSNLFYVSFM